MPIIRTLGLVAAAAGLVGPPERTSLEAQAHPESEASELRVDFDAYESDLPAGFRWNAYRVSLADAFGRVVGEAPLEPIRGGAFVTFDALDPKGSPFQVALVTPAGITLEPGVIVSAHVGAHERVEATVDIFGARAIDDATRGRIVVVDFARGARIATRPLAD
jgi:hypothetical protein